MRQPAPDGIEIVRHFQRYPAEARADLAASHRLHHRQKQRVGEFFWTASNVPGVAFDTKRQAVVAANLAAVGWGTSVDADREAPR